MTPSPRKTIRPGLLLPMQALLEALGARYQRAMKVIDEALDSENFKEKVWAVDWILKRGKTAIDEELALNAALTASSENRDADSTATPAEDLSKLSDGELLTRIRGYLKDWEPD